MSVTLLSEAEQKRVHETLMEMRKKASEDPVYFIETFCYIFNPKQEPFNLRFRMFPFQKRLVRDIVHAVRNGEDLFIDKTREMGVTYTILCTFLWFWLYEPASNFLIGSRKEDYVDNRRGGTTGNKEESLFGKLDYVVSRLPDFIMPKGFNKDRHFNYMSLVNPDNGNAISGESSNPNFSRGGRQRAIFLDEFAFFEEGSAVWGATADTTNCRIIATTPGNKPSKAKRLRFGKDGEKIKIITLNYQLDPRKNKAWLDHERERRSSEDFNREIMVNWETSITGRVYPEIESAAYGDFPFLVNKQLYCSWDLGLDGTSLTFWQQNPANGKYRLVDAYEKMDEIIQFFFPFFGKPMDSAFQYTDDDLKAIKVISQYPKAIHFGDPDVKKRSFVASTTTSIELQKAGIYVQCITKNDFESRKNVTKVYLQKGIEVNQGVRTENWLEAIKAARYPQREESSQATTPIDKPIHDWCLSGETMIRTLDGWFPIEDLVDQDFWVWSYDEQRRRMVPKKTSHCWKSGINSPTIVVGLDDGHSIRCTPNHPFMLRDGTYIEAQDLQKGDSLMPFYERNDGGYVDIILNDGSHGPEHQLVYAEVFGIKDQDSHVHHIDDCKWHNSPKNLEEIDPADHCSKTFSGIPNGKRSKFVPPYIPYSSRSKIYRDCGFCEEEFLADHKTFYCSTECRKSNDRRQLRDRAKYDQSYRQLAKRSNKDYEERHKKECDSCGYRRSRRVLSCPQCHNHKVRFVQKDMKRIDVYDIEVPDTHNFVAEGVVTHNTSHARTSMEYFFVNIDTYSNVDLNRPSWADKASDMARGAVRAVTSRSAVMKARR